VPGVGAQGGKLQDLQTLMHSDVGLLVNSSRKIIYASSKGDFAERAGDEAAAMQAEMKEMLARR
ncbi:MAG: orotidine 5'-phosphate decarboxylase, partial [Cryomorphaceae bacterium]